MNWSNNEITLLKQLFSSHTYTQLAAILKKSETAVKCKAIKIGLRRGRKRWSKQELAYLKKMYANTPTWVLAKTLNKTQESIYRQANIMNLSKSDEYLNSPFSGRIRPGAQLGLGSRFEKGGNPWNKGKKMPKGYCDNKPNMKRTQFKKGNKPHNTASRNGVVVIRTDSKTKIQYKYIRIRLRHWIPYHQYLWVQAHGPIPEGHIVVFKDRNTMNCELANLEIITRKENMLRNSIQRLPDNLKKTIRAVSKLKRTIKNYEEQDHRPSQSPV